MQVGGAWKKAQLKNVDGASATTAAGDKVALKDVAISSGSACTSASLEPSYVPKSLGLGDELAHSSIRFSMGRFTTEAEVDLAADRVVKEALRLREMSPLWEMVQEGIDITKVKWTHH